MAIKAPRKKKARAAPLVRRGGKLLDFNWTGAAELSGEQFHKLRHAGIRFYYDNYKPADMIKFLFQWMQEMGGYKKPEIDAIKCVPSYRININTCILSKCLLTGMPDVHEDWNDYWLELPGTFDKKPDPVSTTIKNKIEEVLEEGKELLKAKKKEERQKAKTNTEYKPTIQDRIKEQAVIAYRDIDEWLETFIQDPKTFDPNGFDFSSHFASRKITQAHARKMKVFMEGELEEMRELQNAPTPAKLKIIKDDRERDMIEQLKEGYSHLKKADVTKLLSALEGLDSALDMIIEEGKANRKSPVRKPKSADKQVAKIKYKVKDEKYQLVSINPSNIIGANELWVFNTKTRKIGRYVAANIDPTGISREGSGLQVKGTTIQGFVEAESLQRTLRKPEEQLKEFKSAGKVKLRKHLETINTLETKLNGRLNADTIILKAS